jgi:hypothetical protein
MEDLASAGNPSSPPKKRRPGLTFADLPLFATDAELGVALLGRARAALWNRLVQSFEREGLPKNDPLMGGRYVPAVKAFFDRQYGLTSSVRAASGRPAR